MLGLGDDRPLTLLQPCPWCRSALVVHAAHALGPHVECTGRIDVCEAPCTTWVQGRPMWRWNDLAALGQALDAPMQQDGPALVDDAERGRRAPHLTTAEQDRMRAELTPGAA
ncbi:hypothetical protein ACFZBU_47235 [Embleya sp. NPDC008237]|uniref:hypothetical protein n=1 Tax=Embleya sp. NPDC008237 TaxID=3363978 RepID=UPI0036EFD469